MKYIEYTILSISWLLSHLIFGFFKCFFKLPVYHEVWKHFLSRIPKQEYLSFPKQLS